MGSSKNPKNKSREERVEDFYRILSAVAAVGFFIGYIVVNKIIQIDTSGIDDEEEGGHGEEEWIDVE